MVLPGASSFALTFVVAFIVTQATFFEIDVPAQMPRPSSHLKLVKRGAAFKVPNKDADFGKSGKNGNEVRPTFPTAPGADARCAQHCVDIVKKEMENSTVGCSTLTLLQDCLTECSDGKFTKYLRYNLAQFHSAYCKNESIDGFAEMADKIRVCEQKLHRNGEYMLTKLWDECVKFLHPDALEEYCMAMKHCFFEKKFKYLKRTCSVALSNFYEFEIKSTFAIRQNVFGSSRVTPRACYDLYDVPSN